MASMNSSSTIENFVSLQPSKAVGPEKFKSYGFSKKKGFVSSKRNVRGLTVTNVATPPLPKTSSPPQLPSYQGGDGRDPSHVHVAWTSVRQERWEGELVVDGEIPLWLVCNLIIIH